MSANADEYASPGPDDPPMGDFGMTADDQAREGLTEDAMALRLVDHVGDVFRYVPERGRWLRWAGSRWAWDVAQVLREHTRELARTRPDHDKELTRFRQRALSAQGVSNTVRLASTDRRVVALLAELDADAYALNTPEGVVDLRTGSLRPLCPDELVTKTTSTRLGDAAAAPGLPPGQIERPSDYTLHGTTTLFATLEIATGKGVDACQPRHRHQEFLAFLKHVAMAYPCVQLHVACDNYATHKHAAVQGWLEPGTRPGCPAGPGGDDPAATATTRPYAPRLQARERKVTACHFTCDSVRGRRRAWSRPSRRHAA